ncbi:MAG: amino acid ABC transporter permease, partial [Hyphomicrobiaceae bacterium]
MAEQSTVETELPKPEMSFRDLLYSNAARGIAYQAILAFGVILFGYFLYANVSENLATQGIATGFEFLEEKSGFDIGESVVAYDSADTYARALWVGILNTLNVAAWGIVLATFLGVALGIARVSSNWFAAKFSSAYVEVVRNVPVVLHVIFWAAFLRNLPGPRQSWTPFEGLYLNNRGLIFAAPVEHPLYTWVGFAFIVAVIASFAFAHWARRRRENTGRFVPVLWPVLGLLVGLPLVTWLVGGAPLVWDMPVFRGFNFVGGSSLTPEFVGLLIGITVYTAAFIAEIVRAGIQSVPTGQIEAARSLGLRPGWIMR